MIYSGECFALIGNNGAGKTAIFKMLTGQTAISNGEIIIKGLQQQNQLKNIYKSMGYCPQIDALLVSLTVRETMEIFARLRGIPAKEIKAYIEYMARSLDLIQHINKRVEHLRSVVV